MQIYLQNNKTIFPSNSRNGQLSKELSNGDCCAVSFTISNINSLLVLMSTGTRVLISQISGDFGPSTFWVKVEL
jgi:hypothetical protein